MDKINEFKAAVEFGFSPDLLRWLTAYSVIDNEKLPYTEEDGLYHFKRSDLEKLDKKMWGMWPLTPKGIRPTIPAGIKKEIKEEAQFACPACNRNQGELAHIKPVAKTYCNHPFNLIFLCPSHHQEYDFGHRIKNITIEDVKAFKDGLQRFNKIQWALKGKIIQTYLGALNTAKSLLEVNNVISKIIGDEKFDKVLTSVASAIESKKDSPEKIKLSTKSLNSAIDVYIQEHPEDLCPLCKGHGSTAVYDPCPICLGDGFASEDDPRLEHLEDFAPVDCQLCEGTGSKDNDTCPACAGERQVARGWADQHDWSMYDEVDCQLCDGTGSKDNDTCPACAGERQVARGWADQHDWSIHDEVDCQLCDGTGSKDTDTCPACDGEGQISKGWADQHDWSIHDEVDCQLCDGTGSKDTDTCPACDGEGQISKGWADQHDWSIHDEVDCQLCDGTGSKDTDTCPACDGEGQISKGWADQHDWSRYESEGG